MTDGETPYNPEWPALFREIAACIRAALGSAAMRIDHVGATAVPGLAAKPVIDVQVSVVSFERLDSLEPALTAAGFQYHPENQDKTQRFFASVPGTPRAHVHIRLSGSFQETFTLLFRDYMRLHPEDARTFEGNKSALDLPGRGGMRGYDGRGELVWGIVTRVEKWSRESGWAIGPSDA